MAEPVKIPVHKGCCGGRRKKKKYKQPKVTK
jgi:hypothetical protein